VELELADVTSIIGSVLSNGELAQLGFGGVVGYLMGWGFKKLVKLISMIVGATLAIVCAILLYLNSQGVITINYTQLESLISNFEQWVLGIAEFGVVPTKPYEDAGARILENARMIAKDMAVEAGTILETCYGNPAQRIIQVAEERKFDLITISSREHSLLHSVLLGSVCDTVTRNAPCPVLVVR